MIARLLHPRVLGLIVALVPMLGGTTANARQAVETPAAGAMAARPESAATFQTYAVAADHPLASQAGAEILAKGGNAVDAAVATSFALSVVRPFSCGIGGGGFMVIDLPTRGNTPRVSIALNYRETCPAAIGPEFFEKQEAPNASTRGGPAVATPGTVFGLLHALEKYGTMDRAAVLAPAIRFAREGFIVDDAYAKAAQATIKRINEQKTAIDGYPTLWNQFLLQGSVKTGDRIVLPDQAAALELIARDGAKAMTDGKLGEAIVASVKASGGVLTLDDLRSFRVREVEPIRVHAMDWTFVTMPPPSSGGVALAQTIGILEKKDLKELAGPESRAVYMHTLVEAFKHAFADRAEWMADPAFVDVPVQRLLSDDYLAARASRIKLGQTRPSELYGTREQLPEDGGTSHLSVIDAHGGAVACTETINLLFGSWVGVHGYGFMLNNEMDDFTTKRGEKNAFGLLQSDKNLPAPGKRPLSSMTPTIVLDGDGRVKAIAGASGGPRIISATTQTLLNALLFGMPAGEAVAHPRLHHQWMPNVLEIEEGYPGRHNGVPLPIWMRKMHHQVVDAKDGAAVQLIKRSSKDGKTVWEAASDPRKGGAPTGR